MTKTKSPLFPCLLFFSLAVAAPAAPASFALLKVNGKSYAYGMTPAKDLAWDERDGISLTEKERFFVVGGSISKGGQKNGFGLYFPKAAGNYVGRRNQDTWEIETHLGFSSTNAGLSLSSYNVDARQEDYGFLEVQIEDLGSAWHGKFTASLHKYAEKVAGARYCEIAVRDAAKISGEFTFLKSKIYRR